MLGFVLDTLNTAVNQQVELQGISFPCERRHNILFSRRKNKYLCEMIVRAGERK